MRIIVWLILRVLWLNECLYLYATGWRRRQGNWASPVAYPFARKDPYTHGHAVNAQKLINRFPPRPHARRPKRASPGVQSDNLS